MNNPQVNKFLNESARVVMTDLVATFNRARDMVETYDSLKLATLLPNDATVIVDGRVAEGVTPVTAAGLRLAVENARALVTQLSTKDAKGVSMIDGARSISPRYA